MGSSICDVRRPGLAVALVVMLGARAAPVCAQGGDPPAAKRQAETKLQEGVMLLKEHRYAEALARFQQGYALVPSPLILYDFGLAQLGMGDDAQALQSFEDFLRSATAAPEDKRRKASGYRDDLRKRVGLVTLNADVRAGSVRLDGRDLGVVELPRRFYLAPGAHEFVVSAGDVTQTAAVTCSPGDTQTLAVAVSRRPPQPPAPVVVMPLDSRPAANPSPPSAASPPSPAVGLLVRQPATPDARTPSGPVARDHRDRWWALAVAGTGAVSMGAGLTFGLLASNQAAHVTSDAQNRGVFVPADETSGLRDQRLEIVFLSVGAAAVLAGVGIYALIRHRETGGATQDSP